MEKGTKQRLMYLYAYLVRHTDADHPLSTKQLIRALEREHGIRAGRNTIGEDLAVMRDCGMHIDFHDSTQNLYFFDGQIYQTAELKILIDAIAACRFITQRKSEELITKLLTLTNDHTASLLRRHTTAAGRVKAENEQSYYIIDTINSAIDRKRKVRLYYTDYDLHKRRVLANGGEPYTLSPYALIWDGDCYYVRGWCDERQAMRNLRVDRIDGAPVLLTEAAVPPPRDYDPGAYSRAVFRMYDTDKPVQVTLLCEAGTMKSVIDQFGCEVCTVPVDEEHFEARVNVCCSPTFYGWVFGFDGRIRITAPQRVREEYRRRGARAAQPEESL